MSVELAILLGNQPLMSRARPVVCDRCGRIISDRSMATRKMTLFGILPDRWFHASKCRPKKFKR